MTDAGDGHIVNIESVSELVLSSPCDLLIHRVIVRGVVRHASNKIICSMFPAQRLENLLTHHHTCVISVEMNNIQYKVLQIPKLVNKCDYDASE